MTQKYHYQGGLIAKTLLRHSKNYARTSEEQNEEYFTAQELLEWMDETDRKIMSQSIVAKQLELMSHD